MADSSHALAAAQFGPGADAYVSSAVHADGPDLDRIEGIVRGRSGGRALDLGCGGGHVSYRLSPHTREVVAYDLSPDMLAAVRIEAARRGCANIATVQGVAERLPFGDRGFDLVVSRFSAHHWADLDAGLREAARVLGANGTAVFVDVVSPGTPVLDTHLQAVELLRDRSHVRDYSVSEWLAATARAGLAPRTARTHRLRLAFAPWIERMRTPEAQAAAIRTLQRDAPDVVAEHFALAADGGFSVDVLSLELARA